MINSFEKYIFFLDIADILLVNLFHFEALV